MVRFPFDFRDGSGFELKRFLVIGHVNDAAVLIKTTSRVEHYRARPELLPGVALCTAGQYDPFEAETVIDPANAFAVPHKALKKFYDAYTLDILGCVPELRDKLVEAITRNGKIEKTRKQYMLDCLKLPER